MIKYLTTNDSYATFEVEPKTQVVFFIYQVYIDTDNRRVQFEESATIDVLESMLFDELVEVLSESFRIQIESYLDSQSSRNDYSL